MEMNRRSFLTSVASLTALSAASGCISNAGGQNSTPKMAKTVTVSNVERRPPAEPEKLDEDEKPAGLEIDLNIGEAEITPSSTARVTLTYTNTGEDTLKLNINPDGPAPLPSEMDDPGLILLSNTYDPTRAADCWKPEQESFPQLAVAYQYPIERGESATLAYDVWAAPQQEADCIRPADYQFKPLYGSFTLTVTTNESGK